MSRYYKLQGHVAIPDDNLMRWVACFENANRRVAEDNPAPDVRVSTVFLGIDHSFGDGPPLLFETMIFGGVNDGYQERCTTWEQAEAMHAAALTLIQKGTVNEQ